MAGMIPTPAELLRRLGVDAEGATAAELPHNRWLSPGVWRIRAGSGQPAVLKYTQSARSRGEVDAGFKFRERSQVLQFNARWARQALDLADELGR